MIAGLSLGVFYAGVALESRTPPANASARTPPELAPRMSPPTVSRLIVGFVQLIRRAHLVRMHRQNHAPTSSVATSIRNLLWGW